MANTSRRYTDANGNMFIPMNVEGSSYNDNFMTSTKLITLACIIVSLGIFILWLSSRPSTIFSYLIVLGFWAIVTMFLTRYVIFEEKAYYKMYKELKESNIVTPAAFWTVASIKDTENGGLITYTNATIGLVVQLDRDTITGKEDEFKEVHYDAISDFYKKIVTMGYSFVQLNLMEQAGKDTRLAELDKLLTKSDNPNIRRLMELQVGYIKSITQKTLYESDYFLILANNIHRVDNMFDDVIEAMFCILEGSYVGYRILGSKELNELIKEEYGVKYFNSTEASLFMYKNVSASQQVPFKVTGILWSDDTEQELNNQESAKLRNITSAVIRSNGGIATIGNVSIKKEIYRKQEKKAGITFDTLDNFGRSKPKPVKKEEDKSGDWLEQQVKDNKVVETKIKKKHKRPASDADESLSIRAKARAAEVPGRQEDKQTELKDLVSITGGAPGISGTTGIDLKKGKGNIDNMDILPDLDFSDSDDDLIDL